MEHHHHPYPYYHLGSQPARTNTDTTTPPPPPASSRLSTSIFVLALALAYLKIQSSPATTTTTTTTAASSSLLSWCGFSGKENKKTSIFLSSQSLRNKDDTHSRSSQKETPTSMPTTLEKMKPSCSNTRSKTIMPVGSTWSTSGYCGSQLETPCVLENTQETEMGDPHTPRVIQTQPSSMFTKEEKKEKKKKKEEEEEKEKKEDLDPFGWVHLLGSSHESQQLQQHQLGQDGCPIAFHSLPLPTNLHTIPFATFLDQVLITLDTFPSFVFSPTFTQDAIHTYLSQWPWSDPTVTPTLLFFGSDFAHQNTHHHHHPHSGHFYAIIFETVLAFFLHSLTNPPPLSETLPSTTSSTFWSHTLDALVMFLDEARTVAALPSPSSFSSSSSYYYYLPPSTVKHVLRRTDIVTAFVQAETVYQHHHHHHPPFHPQLGQWQGWARVVAAVQRLLLLQMENEAVASDTGADVPWRVAVAWMQDVLVPAVMDTHTHVPVLAARLEQCFLVGGKDVRDAFIPWCLNVVQDQVWALANNNETEAAVTAGGVSRGRAWQRLYQQLERWWYES